MTDEPPGDDHPSGSASYRAARPVDDFGHDADARATSDADAGAPVDADAHADMGAHLVADAHARPSAGADADPVDRLRVAAKRSIEALVLVTEEPLSAHLLGQLLEMSPVVVDELCRELAAEYEDQGRGFQLVEVAGGWRYQSHPDLAPYVERFVLEGQSSKLSAAALETLAIVAYKQPISRAQVAAIRGVSVDGVMRTLQQRGYIAEIGKDPGPGQAVLFGTTPLFLEKLGLNHVDELPPLGDFVPGADVVEQLEQGLRPDREPLRPEDAMDSPDGEGGHDPLSWLSEVPDDDGIDLDADGEDAGPGAGADVHPGVGEPGEPGRWPDEGSGVGDRGFDRGAAREPGDPYGEGPAGSPGE